MVFKQNGYDKGIDNYSFFFKLYGGIINVFNSWSMYKTDIGFVTFYCWSSKISNCCGLLLDATFSTNVMMN